MHVVFVLRVARDLTHRKERPPSGIAVPCYDPTVEMPMAGDSRKVTSRAGAPRIPGRVLDDRAFFFKTAAGLGALLVFVLVATVAICAYMGFYPQPASLR